MSTIVSEIRHAIDIEWRVFDLLAGALYIAHGLVLVAALQQSLWATIRPPNYGHILSRVIAPSSVQQHCATLQLQTLDCMHFEGPPPANSFATSLCCTVISNKSNYKNKVIMSGGYVRNVRASDSV